MREQAAGQQAEIGWVLDPAVQGRGLGTAFAAALRDVAVDGLGVRRVEASCFAGNLAWRRSACASREPSARSPSTAADAGSTG